MEIQGLNDILANHPFFANLDPEFLGSLSGCAENCRFDRGHFLFQEGRPADRFYLITRGRVALEMSGRSGPMTFQQVPEGEILGWSWLIPPYRWQFGALAVEMTTAISFHAECVRGKCEADHSLGYELMKRINALICERLNSARQQIVDIG